MTDGFGAVVDHGHPRYCPGCETLVREWYDRNDETLVCPRCRSVTYTSKTAYIEATHGVARWRRKNGYEGGADA